MKVFKLNPDAILPTRNYPTDAGVDLYALEDVYISRGYSNVIKTGIAAYVPDGYFGLLKERSSIGKLGLKVAGGVIDAGYLGDISIILINLAGPPEYKVSKGDRVAQLIVLPIEVSMVEEVSELWSSQRGNKSFGSSGK